MLEHIHIEGYKSFSTENPLDIDLRNVNVMIGPNGAGKSRLVSFLDMLEVLLTAKWNNYVLGVNTDSMFYYGQSITKEIFAELRYDDGFSCCFTLVPGEMSRVVVNTHDSDREEMASRFGGVRAYHFSDTANKTNMRGRSHQSQFGELYTDGSNLVAFLLRLHDAYNWYYRRIVERIRLIMPQFEDFVLEPNDAGYLWLEWNDRSSVRRTFTPNDLSDGSLRFIALTTLLLQPPKLMPKLLVIDEPELGLHPAAIDAVNDMIKEASFHTQIVVATQSPTLIDAFDPDCIMVAESRNNNGLYYSSVKRLDRSALDDWLKEYTVSDLWYKNILGGLPL